MKPNILKTLTAILFIAITATAQTVWDGTANASWYTYNLSASTYTITTAEELAGLARIVNGGNSMSGKTITLGADIQLNNTEDWQDWSVTPPERNWIPIGNDYNTFSGTFDGAGYVISGVYINSTNSYQGLFGYLGSSGAIKNIGVVDSYIKGGGVVGGLVGYGGTISNSYSTGTVSGSSYVGGLVGSNSGTISNSYSTGTVSGSSYVGGLVGSNQDGGTISNNYATGTVTGSGNSIGGLVGSNGGTVSNSYSTGAVICNDDYVGGLVGSNSGTISNSYSTGTVSGSSYVGGLVGSGGTVSNSYSTGTVSGNNYVGGLVGSGGTVSNSYSIGTVNSTVSNNYYDIKNIREDKETNEIKSETFVKDLNFVAGVLGMNTWVYEEGEYPKLTNTPASIDIASYFAGGTGTEANPYLITTKKHLENLFLFVNIGKKTFADKYFKLGNSIALNDTTDWQNWVIEPPISSWAAIGTNVNSFNGIFDGAGYAISGIYINNNTSSNQGLFGYLGEDGTIKNVGVAASYINGGGQVGGLVGYNIGTVSNSYFAGTVIGGNNVGGLVGSNSGTISNSYSTGTVSGNSSVGGLVGNNNNGGGTVNSYYDKQTCGQTTSTGGEGKTTLEMKSEKFASLLNIGAGIFSMNAWEYREGEYPKLSNTPANAIDIASYFASGIGTEANPYIITTKEQLEALYVLVDIGKISYEHFKLGNDIALNDTTGWQNWGTTAPANSWAAIGTYVNSFNGIFDGAGYVISGIYINSINDCQGLFGNAYNGTIKNVGVVASYINGGSNVGGLAGNNYGTVSNSYFKGSVNGSSSVGGLMGNGGGTVSNSYSTGTVSGNSNVGGLVGYNVGSINNSYSTGMVSGENSVGGLVGFYMSGRVSNSYYDKQTYGQTTSTGGEGKTTLEMKTQTTYIDWDFTAVWAIDPDINNGYPYLKVAENPTPMLPKIANGKIHAQTIGNNIVLQNLQPNSKVEVYNLKGNRIYLGNTGSISTLSIGVQTKGIYVVKATRGSEMQTMRVVVR